MNRQDVEDLVSDKISAAVSSSQNTLLSEITRLISTEVKKISDNQKSLSELQLNKIASNSSSDYKFQRKSNEEQFKVHIKVMEKIDDCDRNLNESEIQQAKENLAEGTNVLLYFILFYFAIFFFFFFKVKRNEIIRIQKSNGQEWYSTKKKKKKKNQRSGTDTVRSHKIIRNLRAMTRNRYNTITEPAFTTEMYFLHVKP